MVIYKYTTIITNIDATSVENQGTGAIFYTEDENTASIKIKIQHDGIPFNLDSTTMLPSLSLFCADGSIFTNVPVNIIDAYNGEISYDISSEVIKRAGRVRAKFFLESAEESVHVANFYFEIRDSGMDSVIEKIVDIQIIDDKIKAFLDAEPERFRGDSAYQIAVNNGFVGTEQEWIASLDGKDAVITDGSIEYRHLSDTNKATLSADSMLREYQYPALNVMPYPNGTHFTTYATNTNDPYYHSFMGSGTTPAASLDSNQSNVIAAGGYFFYRVKYVSEFLKTGKVSILLRNTNTTSKVEFRFMDSGNVQIGSIVSIPRFKDDVYLIENVAIPTNTSYIDVRIDNRTGTESTTLIKPVITPYERITLSPNGITELQQRTTNVEKSVEALKVKTIGSHIVLNKPTGFNIGTTELDGKVYMTYDGLFVTDYDVTTKKQSKGTVYYVDFDSGLDTNNGLSKDTPFKSIYKAYNMADVGEIKLKGTKHFRYGGNLPALYNKPLNITSYDGIAKIIPADRLEWTKSAGYTNVYQISRSATGKVVDLSRKLNNGYIEFKKKTSIAEVDATPDSWYTDGTIVYANYSTQPVSDMLVALLTSDSVRITSQTVDYFYIQDVELIGGNRPFRNESEICKSYFKNVKFLHSAQSNGNGMEIVGGISSIAQGCVCESNNMDGFNYHIGATGTKPYVIEIDCISVENGSAKGTAGSQSNNGSTLHDGLKGIRLNGLYGRNDGGNVADVNAGTQSWNLNVRAFESYQQIDFLTSTGAEMWIDSGKGYGSAESIKMIDTADKVHLRNGNYQKITGTVDYY